MGRLGQNNGDNYTVSENVVTVNCTASEAYEIEGGFGSEDNQGGSPSNIGAGGGTTVNTGEVNINVCNSQNGVVKYRIGNTGEFTPIYTSSNTLRKDNELKDVTTGTKIYLQAVPNTDQKLDTTSGQNRIRYDDIDHDIATDQLANGTYCFLYDLTKAYSVNITFEGNGENVDPPAINYPNDITINFGSTDISSLAEVKINGQSHTKKETM